MVDEVGKMFNKKVVIGICSGVALLSTFGYLFLNTSEEEETVQVPEVQQVQVPPPPVKQVAPKPIEPAVKKTDLYNLSDKNIPLSAIADLADLPVSVRKTVEMLLDTSYNGIYFLNSSSDKITVILGEEDCEIKRHDINFIEVSLADGSILDSQVEDKDSIYDKWKYKNGLPLSHTRYNDDNEIVYNETWNYSEDEPIKYKKSDKDGKTISLRKEVIENDVNLREEHLFYDNEGRMVKNVSLNYDGTDLTRFTYYNSQEDSVMLVSDFEDGIKKKETLYSADYKMKNIYLPEYKDGQKSKIKIFDKDNKLVETLVEE